MAADKPTVEEMIEACDRRATTLSFRSVFAPVDPKQEAILTDEALKFQSAASQLRSEAALRARLAEIVADYRGAAADNRNPLLQLFAAEIKAALSLTAADDARLDKARKELGPIFKEEEGK